MQVHVLLAELGEMRWSGWGLRVRKRDDLVPWCGAQGPGVTALPPAVRCTLLTYRRKTVGGQAPRWWSGGEGEAYGTRHGRDERNG